MISPLPLQMPQHQYGAFGLRFCSEIELPELSGAMQTPVESEAVHVRRAANGDDLPAAALFPQGADYRPFLRRDCHTVDLLWPEVGRARVIGGREIIVAPDADVPEHILRLHILGSALGLLLHQRHLLTLHASAVMIDDGAVAFLGRWGAGKSTTAVALHEMGCELLTDDIVAVDLRAAQPQVRVGFPQFKLWPETVEALGQTPANLDLVHPEEEKRIKTPAAQTHCVSMPLRGIYLLDIDERLIIEPVPANAAFMELLVNWYGARFGADFLTPAEHQGLFQQCTKLAHELPFFALKRPDALDRLDELAQAVIAHAQSMAPTRNS